MDAYIILMCVYTYLKTHLIVNIFILINIMMQASKYEIESIY